MTAFLLFVTPSNVYAIGRIYPDSFYAYNGKRLWEKIVLLTKFSPTSKVKYMQKLLNERELELEYIIETKNSAHIEKTSQRYETTAGQLAEFIIKRSLKRSVGTTKDKFDKHTVILNYFKNEFSQDTAEWRFVQNDINSLKIYSDKLSSF